MMYSQSDSLEGDHGRIERRRCTVLPLMYLYGFNLKWQGLQSLICVKSERSHKGNNKVSCETRYYISSLTPEAEKIGHAIRTHWRIENNLHWSLDVAFTEDESRIRTGHAAENFAWVRRLALSLLKKESSYKASIKRKRFKALMNNDYLLSVLKAGQMSTEN